MGHRVQHPAAVLAQLVRDLLVGGRDRQVHQVDVEVPAGGQVVLAHAAPDHQAGGQIERGYGANRIALGITVNDDAEAIAEPAFAWVCPPLSALALGLFVMAIVVPLMEETVHRGLLLSAFIRRGPMTAILVSALIFTVLHPPTSYGFVFFMGLVLGAQFWLTGSLWVTVVTHATYNGLIQFDWRCLQGQWNPPPESLPLAMPAVMALAAVAGSLLLIGGLLRLQQAGAASAPAPDS